MFSFLAFILKWTTESGAWHLLFFRFTPDKQWQFCSGDYSMICDWLTRQATVDWKHVTITGIAGSCGFLKLVTLQTVISSIFDIGWQLSSPVLSQTVDAVSLMAACWGVYDRCGIVWLILAANRQKKYKVMSDAPLSMVEFFIERKCQWYPLFLIL